MSSSRSNAGERATLVGHNLAKTSRSGERIQQGPPNKHHSEPHVYDQQSSKWIPLQGGECKGLGEVDTLKVVSWNIECFGAGQACRASASLAHLMGRFKDNPPVIMQQEVCSKSIRAIRVDLWVRQNFILTNIKGPESITDTDIRGPSSVPKRLDWNAAPYFTLIMVPRDIGVSDCFRVPFETNMGRDALFVDIPVRNTVEGEVIFDKALCLCTTHLGSLLATEYRRGQLALISSVFREEGTDYSIVGGLSFAFRFRDGLSDPKTG